MLCMLAIHDGIFDGRVRNLFVFHIHLAREVAIPPRLTWRLQFSSAPRGASDTVGLMVFLFVHRVPERWYLNKP